MKKERIPLLKLFRAEDRADTGKLTIAKFKSILDDNRVVFRPTDFNCIKIKFDLDFRHETIDYVAFMNSLEKANSGIEFFSSLSFINCIALHEIINGLIYVQINT